MSVKKKQDRNFFRLSIRKKNKNIKLSKLLINNKIKKIFSD